MDILSGLNPAQQEAVIHDDGPLLILAGAGSGKTKALTHRIAHLISEKEVWPNRILAVTFTNKAAREMRQRLASMLGQNADDRSFMPWMGTFHSVCVRLLRLEGSYIGVPANFVIYDENDRRALIKQAMKNLQITDKDIKPSAVSSIISAQKNKLVSPEEFADESHYPFQQKVAAIYQEYEKQRRAAQCLDFDDILIEAVRLFKNNPDIRKKWQTTFEYILVDEYQDTNVVQYQLVKLLINPERNICVVGDDWQSIYSWRGADFTNILNFERDFPGAKVVKLEQNYRSSGAILRVAQSVISKNTERTDKVLWTDAGDGQPVQLTEVYNEAEEAALVASRIARGVNAGVRQYSDFAVLYRTNAQSYAIEKAMRHQMIPYKLVGNVRFLDRAEVKDILSYFKLAYQPNDLASFMRIANVPTRGVGAASLAKFLTWQAVSGYDVITALVNVGQTSAVTARARQSLQKLGEVMQKVQSKIQSNANPGDIIDYIIDAVHYRDYLQDGTPQAEDRIENIGMLISDAKAYEEIDTFLEETALMSSSDESADGEEVTLMTLHAAKGLEFPVVFMVGMEEGLLPHSRVADGGVRELEEERRLCYVGMTRAQEELMLSYASSRMQYGSVGYNEPSRFLKDMGDEILPSRAGRDYESTWEPNHFNVDEDNFDEVFLSDGDRVKSPSFGTGTVVEVDGMAAVVEFDDGKTKKLNIEYARLEKL